MNATLRTAVLALTLLLAAPAFAAVAVPPLVPVQGALRTVGGGPVPDGKYVIVLKLYDAPEGGQALFAQVEVAVPVSQGSFAVTLGAGGAGGGTLPAGLFAQHGELWLGAAVAGEPELPRAPLLPVPFALRAVQADAAKTADVAKLADKAVLAETAEEAKVAFLAETAKALACTGCVGTAALSAQALAAGSHTATWAGQPSTVQAGLDAASAHVSAYEKAIPIQDGKVGLGVAKPQCGVDLGPLCQQGQEAFVVVRVPDQAAMTAIQLPGAVVYRADAGSFWGRTPTEWRQLAFTAKCGDGALEPGELCDDGNQDATDACVACKPATCGDGAVQAGKEACDDANAVDTDACIACQKAKCGDGFVHAGVEACDQGAGNSDTQANACRTTCVKAKCGDKVVDAGEQCDDGNTADKDGCSATCQSEGGKFKGYATWSQNVSAQSDAQQDAAMDAACQAAFAGSKAATVDEIVGKTMQGLPGSNGSGQHLLGKCPNCAGNNTSSAVDKHCRLCVDPGAQWPVGIPAGWNSNCCNSTRTAVCVGP